ADEVFDFTIDSSTVLVSYFGSVGYFDFYNIDGTHVSRINTSYSAGDVTSSGGRYYLSDGSTVRVVDTSGTVLDSWPILDTSYDLAVSSDLLYVATGSAVHGYSIGGAQERRAALNTSYGQFESTSAVLEGVTKTQFLDTLHISSSEVNLDRVAIDKPIFPLGSNNFSNEADRDYWIPNPPDGTRATTGSGTPCKSGYVSMERDRKRVG